MPTLAYVAALKARFSLTSDYQVAKKLQIGRATVSLWKKGRTMDDETAVFVAELLELSPAHVLADIHAERTKSPHLRRIWTDAAAELAEH